MKAIKVNTVYETRDYSLFEPHPHNRDVQKTKVLQQSMARYGFDDGLPIRCVQNGSGKLKITHGHHRFTVAQNENLPIRFIIASKDIPLFESEASAHAWTIRDYATARARAGEQVAEKILKYHEQTGIPLNCCISLLGGEGAGSGNKISQVKTGRFRIGDTSQAHAVADIIEHCRSLGLSFATSSYFVKAVDKCLLVKEFDAEIFMHKVSVHSEIMDVRRSVDEYIDLIEMVYNRQSKQKIPVAFLARQASASRSICKRSA